MMSSALLNALDVLFQQCAAKKPAFDALIIQLAERTGGVALLVPLKPRERALKKVVGSLNGQMERLTDVLRATLVFETISAVLSAFDAVRTQVHVVRERNLYRDGLTVSDGYRDAKIDFNFDGIPVELQFSTWKMLDAKAKAHGFYEEKRQLLADKRSGVQLSVA